MNLHLLLQILNHFARSDYIETKLDKIMTLGWEIKTSEIEITIKCKISKGYCALGFGSQMSKSDIYLVIIDESEIEVKDCWVRSHITPTEDTDQGGKNSINLLHSSFSPSAGAKVIISRKLETGDSFDSKIIPDTSQSIIWAYVEGTSGVNYHESNKYIAKATFSTTIENFSIETTTSGKDRTNHGLAMSIAWGLLTSIGIISARYFKMYPWWFFIHFTSLLAASLIVISSSALSFKQGKVSYQFLDDDQILHSRTGHLLASLVISQVVFGMAGSYFKLFTKNTTRTGLLMKVHRLVGYVLFVVGLKNLYLGWKLNEDDYKTMMIIIYVVVISLFLALEVFQRVYSYKTCKPSIKLIEMTHFEVMDKVKTGKQLMFADELVVDVGTFFRSHPGGSFLIKDNLGEDVGKYMVGCSSYDGTYNPYTHSTKAFSMLKTLAIGRISSPSGYLSVLSKSESIFMNFTVKDKRNLNSHTKILFLSSSDYIVADYCKEPSWLGKHFMFIFKKQLQVVQRYYSNIFTDFSAWTEPFQETSEKDFGVLKFVFKVYPDGKMTNYLDSLQTGSNVLIRGPLGPGLLIQELSGNFLALAGGTGLAPFIDLVDMAFKKFGNSSDEFQLHLFVFFRNYNDGFALDSLKYFDHHAKWLELFMVTDEILDKKEITDVIKQRASINLDLAWICGPSGFNKNYKKLLREAGLPNEKIIVM